MSKSPKLSKRQVAVLDDLFAGEFEGQAVLEKHHVSPSLFERWLAEERFAEQFEQRIVVAHRQSRLILARHASLAAAKLVQLMESENQETARKACLDIISLHTRAGREGLPDATPGPAAPPSAHALSPETAGRLLAALVGDEPRADRDSV